MIDFSKHLLYRFLAFRFWDGLQYFNDNADVIGLGNENLLVIRQWAKRSNDHYFIVKEQQESSHDTSMRSLGASTVIAPPKRLRVTRDTDMCG